MRAGWLEQGEGAHGRRVAGVSAILTLGLPLDMWTCAHCCVGLSLHLLSSHGLGHCEIWVDFLSRRSDQRKWSLVTTYHLDHMETSSFT